MKSLLPAADYGTTGLASWIQDNVITVIVLVIAAAVLWAARGGNIAKGLTIAAGLLVGLAVLGIATGNNAEDIGNFVVDLFKS